MFRTKRYHGRVARTQASRPRLEFLEDRITPSYADGNGAVVTNLIAQNNGTQLVLTFDGPLNATPTNPAQSPSNTANYSVEIPGTNPQMTTSSNATLGITTAVYNNLNFTVTLTLTTPLNKAASYRVFVNGISSADNTPTPGLLDGKSNPIDGDYDDTASGNFYGLFAWTTAATPLQFTDSSGNNIKLTLTGPGELHTWRMLNGDFNALSLASQANQTAGNIQQINIIGGVLAQTTLTGQATPPNSATGTAYVVVPPINGQGVSFVNNLPANFQLVAPPLPLPNTPIPATGNNLPYTLQIQQVTATLPAVQSAVFAQDNVVGSPFNGYWLLFGGRTNGLHTFTGNNDFPPEDMNEDIIVINPATWQVWTRKWNTTNVPAAVNQPLYSTNQQSFQDGDNLYTVGGYGAPDQGGGQFGSYVTNNSLTALSVDGLIKAVVNNGDVMALSHLEQIKDPRLQATGGELAMLGGEAFLVVGQNFQGQYFSNTATQTYLDEIRIFTIAYSSAIPGSLGISNFRIQNDQVNFRRRDYTLTNLIQPNLQPALQINGGVFTPGPFSDPAAGQGYRQPILITGPGQTQLSTYQQFFSQYSAAHVGLFDANTSSMYSILFGGIGLYSYDFATGQLTSDIGLPFVNDVTTIVQANGVEQEYAMPSQLPGFYGAEAQFFTNPQLPRYANGVVKLDQLQQTVTLGYMYGGIVSTVPNTTNQTEQTKASSAVFRIVLVPAPTATISSSVISPTSNNPIPVSVTFSQAVTGLTAAEFTVTQATISDLQAVNPVNGFATTWTFNLVPTGAGAVSVQVNAGAAQNSAGTNNAASNNFSITYQPATQTVGSFDPITATWYLRNSNTSGPPDVTPFAYGAPNWYPVTGDWDGDGLTTIGVVDLVTMTWYLRNSNSGGLPSYTPFRYGAPGWIPVVGDWTGAGHSSIGVFDPTAGNWFLRTEISGGLPDAGAFSYGAPGWFPVAGDWTGVGHAGIGVFNPNTANWYLRTELSSGDPDANPGSVPFGYGAPGWVPVVGDWSGQGKVTVGVVNPGNGTWFLRNSNSSGAPSFTPFNFGAPGWGSVVGNWVGSPLPQLAASNKAAAASVNPPLTDQQLQSAVHAAMTRLQTAGISSNVLAALTNIRFTVGTLTNHELGLSDPSNRQVVIDATAGGLGWFVDQTPLQDEEFTTANGKQTAKAGSAAAGHMDLLTVLLHELGHFAGGTELDPALHPDALMALTLPTGTRRTRDIDAVFREH
ncbi:hypothetical protein BH10PLA2_BH10PLA2_07850 [soil metagenome]